MAEVDYQREFVECLRRADRREGCEVGHLFTWHWARGWAEHLEAIGMLERTHDAEWWMCERCEAVSAHVERRYVDDRGVHMAKICCRERGYHLDAVEVEQLRMWSVSMLGLAKLLGRSLRAAGEVRTIVPGRLVSLGEFKSDADRREAFVARGTTWDDAARVFGTRDEIREAGAPLVVVLDRRPSRAIWNGGAPLVVSATNTRLAGDRIDTSDWGLLAGEVEVPTTEWMTLTQAATRVLDVVSDTTIEKARARVAGAVRRGRIRTNGRSGTERRLEPGTFSVWLLEQRERDLAAEDPLRIGRRYRGR